MGEFRDSEYRFVIVSSLPLVQRLNYHINKVDTQIFMGGIKMQGTIRTMQHRIYNGHYWSGRD